MAVPPFWLECSGWNAEQSDLRSSNVLCMLRLNLKAWDFYTEGMETAEQLHHVDHMHLDSLNRAEY